MRRKLLYAVLALCAVVLILGILAPFLNADRFRERIREALQSALNRKVEVGEVHFNVFTGPGFSVDDVLIADDPAAGVEPFAHVNTLQARLQFKSLFTWKIAFSKLRLIEPSVNLVKTDAGPWNIQAFFHRAASGRDTSPHASFPDIEIQDGRINFKFGLLKSVFYINDTDAEIYPNSSGDLVLSFSGEPARTDRSAQTFGRISAKGLLHNPGASEDELNMAMQLERSALSELVRLFDARDLGVHGHVASNATLSGPLSHITIAGALNVSDLHRWDLMPAEGEDFMLKYRGLLNFPAQQLDLETDAAPDEKIPAALKFKATDFITAPKWAASVLFQDLPAASLVDMARRLGAAVPSSVRVEGSVNGGIGVSTPGGLQGQLRVANASFSFPDASSVRVAAADILIADRITTLTPTELTLDNGHSARIEAEYDNAAQDFSMRMDTNVVTAADLKSAPARLVDAASIPVLALCRQGAWDGTVRYRKKGDSPGEWSGAFELQNTQLDLPGVATPLRIVSAAVEIDAGKVQIKNLRGHLGEVPVQAEYHFDIGGGPHSLRLIASQASLAELQRLFLPTLRRRQGFLARFRRAPAPEWLQDRNIEGTIQIRRLALDNEPVCAFKTRIAWNGTTAQFTNATCTLDDLEASGRITINLAGSVPQYRLSGTIENFESPNGNYDFEGEFGSSGLGAEVLLNASSKGVFTGRDVRLSNDTTLREVTGAFELTPALTGPRLALSKIQASDGVDSFTGQGTGLADGRIVLDLTTAAKRQVKLTGSLFAVRTPATQ